jgi:molybdate transport system substrate-binding protein
LRIALAVLAVGLTTATSAVAAEVRVMSAGAVEPGLEAAARLFRERTGDVVTIQYATGPQLQARLAAGESADLLIAPRAVMQTAKAAGKVAGEPVVVGRVGIGVAIRKGAPRPDISSAEALAQAMRAAKAVVYNRGSTGVHIEGAVKAMGLAEPLAARTVRPENGEGVVARLVEGSGAEIGFGAATEIRLGEAKGVELVGPAPGAFQNATTYVAAPFVGARPQTQAFLTLLTGAEGRAALTAAGAE